MSSRLIPDLTVNGQSLADDSGVGTYPYPSFVVLLPASESLALASEGNSYHTAELSQSPHVNRSEMIGTFPTPEDALKDWARHFEVHLKSVMQQPPADTGLPDGFGRPGDLSTLDNFAATLMCAARLANRPQPVRETDFVNNSYSMTEDETGDIEFKFCVDTGPLADSPVQITLVVFPDDMASSRASSQPPGLTDDEGDE